MGVAIGQALGFAVGVAISPAPIIAVILMLFSKRAGSNSVAFLVGWLSGLAPVSGIVLVIGLGGSNGNSDGGGWLKLVVGVVFLVLAVKQWRGRPSDGEESPMPVWMASIDDLTIPKAFGLAVLLSAVNPKNLGLTVAAGPPAGQVREAEVVLGADHVLGVPRALDPDPQREGDGVGVAAVAGPLRWSRPPGHRRARPCRWR